MFSGNPRPSRIPAPPGEWMPFPRASRALLAIRLDRRVGNHVRAILHDSPEKSSFAGPWPNPREEGGG